MLRLLLLCVLFATDAFAAVTYPTAPRSTPDIRIADPLCTITIANEAAFQAYLTGTTRTNCATGGNGPPTFGDRVELAAGVTFQAAASHLLPVPVGTFDDGVNHNFVTITSGTGSTCPAEGTRVIGANDPHGFTTNVASLAIVKPGDGNTTNKAFKQNADGINHYRIMCLEIHAPKKLTADGAVNLRAATASPSTLSEHYPSYIVFERNFINIDPDFGSIKVLQIEGAHIKIVDNDVRNAYQNGQLGDANALAMYCGDGPWLIQNNKMGGLGEIYFWGGGPTNACPTVTLGFEYKIPKDITIQYNFLYRLSKWKRDHATYEGPADVTGTGTITASSGNDVTFSNSQTFTFPRWVRGNTSNAKIKLTSGTSPGTGPFTGTWVRGTAFTPGESFTLSSTTSNAMQGKNCLEAKSSQYVEIAYNICHNIWKDSQKYDLTITPREFGWVSDWRAHHNLFYQTGGMSGPTPGDYEGGDNLEPSPYATARMWIHDNAWVDVVNTDNASLDSVTQVTSMSPISDLWGRFATSFVPRSTNAGTGTVSSVGTALTFSSSQTGLAGTCIRIDSASPSTQDEMIQVASGAGTSWTAERALSPAITGKNFRINQGCLGIDTASVGVGRTLTMLATDPFESLMVGDGTNMCIAYIDHGTANIVGKATITGYTDSKHLTVSVTDDWPDTNYHNITDFAYGKCDVVGTARLTMDSLIYEHNGLYPPTTSLYTGYSFNGYPGAFAYGKATNFVWRSNILGAGFKVGSGTNSGFNSDAGVGSGTAIFTAMMDAVAPNAYVYGNNVMWGAQTWNNGLNVKQHYTGALLACEGDDGTNVFSGTCRTAFHDSTYTGATAGGPIGFTDYTNWDVRITGAYATAAHDGTQIGPDINTLARHTAFAYQGTAYTTGGRTATTASTGAGAVAGSGGMSATTSASSCVRNIIAAFDSGC